jgi:predicted nuclease of restriction endonuclease-like (RecB) superfamily
MRQFYEAYRGNEIVSAVLTQIPWTHNLIILSQSKRAEEREFYLRMAIQEKWSSRELERQFKAALFERSMTQPAKVSAVLRQTHPTALSVFKDAYMLEFLGLPGGHGEADLHRGLVQRLKDFLGELGRDFCFVGSQYPVQVGNRDFALDLLFFHRGLNCLVAFELKVGRFEPEYLGKLGFYLEALDRDERKPHESPAIGVLLCASKEDEVVEYALNHSLSPAMVAEYQTRLPDKQLLQAKLHEFYALNTQTQLPEEQELRLSDPPQRLNRGQASLPQGVKSHVGARLARDGVSSRTDNLAGKRSIPHRDVRKSPLTLLPITDHPANHARQWHAVVADAAPGGVFVAVEFNVAAEGDVAAVVGQA